MQGYKNVLPITLNSIKLFATSSINAYFPKTKQASYKLGVDIPKRIFSQQYTNNNKGNPINQEPHPQVNGNSSALPSENEDLFSKVSKEDSTGFVIPRERQMSSEFDEVESEERPPHMTCNRLQFIWQSRGNKLQLVV